MCIMYVYKQHGYIAKKIYPNEFIFSWSMHVLGG